MEAATKERELSGDKAQRIVDAMRDSVARRGAAGSTFEHVAREAGVSRGLLHYYFGTKERLLVEVVRRDAEIRVARLDERLAKAKTVDDVLDVLVASLTDMIENEPGFFLLLYELFSAGRRNPDIQREVGQLFERTRSHVAEVLEAKEREGVLKLRFEAEAIVSYLFAVGDGFALQALSDPERDNSRRSPPAPPRPGTCSSPSSARPMSRSRGDSAVTRVMALTDRPSPVRKAGQPANARRDESTCGSSRPAPPLGRGDLGRDRRLPPCPSPPTRPNT